MYRLGLLCLHFSPALFFSGGDTSCTQLSDTSNAACDAYGGQNERYVYFDAFSGNAATFPVEECMKCCVQYASPGATFYFSVGDAGDCRCCTSSSSVKASTNAWKTYSYSCPTTDWADCASARADTGLCSNSFGNPRCPVSGRRLSGAAKTYFEQLPPGATLAQKADAILLDSGVDLDY